LIVYTLENLYKKGKKIASSSTLRKPTKDTCASFSYTSGTTGDPKGVKLTHGMLISCGAAVLRRLSDQVPNENDRYISYLPAAHSFE
jgi:long-chain acyl-CoA synthetase